MNPTTRSIHRIIVRREDCVGHAAEPDDAPLPEALGHTDGLGPAGRTREVDPKNPNI